VHKDQEIRDKVAKAIRMPNVPDVIWANLVDPGYAAEAIDTEDDSSIIAEAKRLAEAYRAGYLSRAHDGHSDETVDRIPMPKALDAREVSSGSELERAQVASEYLAEVADGLPMVRRFRARVLGGRKLGPADALSLLRSPAAQVLPLQRFRDIGCPLLGHSSRFLGDDRSDEQPSLFTTELELTWADTVHRETLQWRCSTPVSIADPLGDSSIRYWPDSEHLE